MGTSPAARLTGAITARNLAGRSALIPYVTAGFPDAGATVDLLSGLAEAGADVIELGIPFSDPIADGPTIQASSFRALQAGMTLRASLDLLSDFRRRHATPVVVFSYLNPVLRFGVDDFLATAGNAGADGLLLTDLPLGADPELERRVDGTGMALIRLASPTTPAGRMAAIGSGARGFVYYISRTGVTGARQAVREELANEVREIRSRVDVPVAVGFGISTPEQAAEVGRIADGVVVGSALIKAQEEGGVEGALAFVRSLRQALDVS